jgi:hypothetical protein
MVIGQVGETRTVCLLARCWFNGPQEEPNDGLIAWIRRILRNIRAFRHFHRTTTVSLRVTGTTDAI